MLERLAQTLRKQVFPAPGSCGVGYAAFNRWKGEPRKQTSRGEGRGDSAGIAEFPQHYKAVASKFHVFVVFSNDLTLGTLALFQTRMQDTLQGYGTPHKENELGSPLVSPFCRVYYASDHLIVQYMQYLP